MKSRYTDKNFRKLENWYAILSLEVPVMINTLIKDELQEYFYLFIFSITSQL